MEVRPGYKQTEVGVIPEDWDAKKLGMYFIFKNGLNKGKEFFGYGTPIVNYMDVYAHAGIQASHLLGRVDVTRQELESFGVRKGDVFFTRTSETVEEVGIASVLLEDSPNTVFSGFVLRARPIDDALTVAFKKYCFSSCIVRNQIISKSTYTTRALTNGRILAGVLLPHPPTKAEQQAIAEALSDADALIESLEQLIAKKRQIKQGAMQELLTGKKRLPGFSGKWAVKRLDAVAEIFSGGTPSTNQPEFWDGVILWCTPTDIMALNGSKYLSHTARTITEQGLKASAAALIPANSIIMTSRATIGECAINAVPVATNQGFKNFVPFPETDGEFLYYLLQTKKPDFIGLCSGSTFLEIGKTQLAIFEIELPKEKPEQTAIATILSDMDTELAALETKLAKARQIKQGMMQELLTGRIRLV